MSADKIRMTVESPLGPLELELSGSAISRCTFSSSAPAARVQPDAGVPDTMSDLTGKIPLAIESYFNGHLTALDDFEVAPSGTLFRRKVWRALKQLGAGETASYGEIARRVGSPGAARAVGGACGANPIVLFIPCHRVLAHGGLLGGFSSELWRKRHLLSLEGVPVLEKVAPNARGIQTSLIEQASASYGS